MLTTQLDPSNNAAAIIGQNSGQVAVGQYVVQIGSIHGGVVNIAMPEEQPHWQPRLAPILLRPRRFTGLLDREAETSAATAALYSAQPVEFYGPPGLGKTSLLRHLAYNLPTPSCPDGVIYLSAQQQPLADLLQFLFEAFFESNIPAKATEAQIRHGLSQKRALILLDDVELSRSALETLLDAVPQCAFFFVAVERHLWGTGQAMALRGLPPDEALALLARELGRPFTAEEHSTAATLCALLEGHPLHLLQAAALIQDQGNSLAEMTRSLQRRAPQEALVTQILAALSTPERRIVGTLAALGGIPLSNEHVAALTGLPDPTPVLDGLLQRHLVQAHSPRYSLTGPLLQQWPATWDLTPLAERALSYFTRWAEQHQQTPDRVLQEADTLRQILSWAVASAHWPEALRLVRALEESLTLNRQWGAWAQVLQSGLLAAEALGDRAAKAWLWHQLGTRALCLGDLATARTSLSRALRLRETLGDFSGAEVTRHNLNLTLGPPPPSQPPSEPLGSNGIMPTSGGSFWLLVGLAGGLFVLLLILVTWLGWILLAPPTSPPETVISGQLNPPTSLVVSADTPTATLTLTPSATSTSLPTLTFTPTSTPTDTPQPTPTSTNTATLTPTPTPTPTATPSPTPTVTPMPSAFLNPTDLDFGRLRLSETSRTESVSLVNRGRGLLMVNRIVLEGEHPNDYLIDSGNCLAVSGFPANSGCVINVRFRPTATGSRYANLAIYTNSLGSPHRLFLTGTGFAVPAVSFLPSSLDFGEQPVNTASVRQTVIVTSVGPGDLLINSVTLGGTNPSDFAFDQVCTDFVMLPGDSCIIDVHFMPRLTGTRTAELIITDNTPDSPERLSLRGVGLITQPDLVISSLVMDGPAQLNQRSNIEVPISVVVRNQGNAEAAIFKVSTEYTGPDGTFGVAFTVPGQSDLWYPFTSAPLPAGSEVTFAGKVIFPIRLQGETVVLTALADSCNGDELMPATCRVEESREDNNLSEALPVALPTPPIIIE